MEALKLSDVFPVERLRLITIEETREYDWLVYFDYRGQLHVPVIHNSGMQATQGLASFTDTTRYLLVKGSIVRYDACQVPELIDHLQISARYGHFQRRGYSAWGRLVQDFCLAETDS